MKEKELQEATTQLFKEVAKQDSALVYLDGYSVNCVKDKAEIGRPTEGHGMQCGIQVQLGRCIAMQRDSSVTSRETLL